MPQHSYSKAKTKILTRYNFLKVSLLSVITVQLVAIIAILPLGNQILIASALDSVGQSRLAMQLDLISRGKFDTAAGIVAFTNLQDPKQCEAVTKLISNQQIELKSLQGKSLTTLTSANPQYTDQLKLETYLAGNINLEQKRASVDVKADVKINPNLTRSIIEEAKKQNTEASKNSNGNSSNSTVSSLMLVPKLESFEAEFQSVITTGEVFANVPKLDIKTEEITSRNSLNSWYRFNFRNSDESKEQSRQQGIDQSLEGAKEFLNFPISDLLSQGSIDSLTQFQCLNFERAEIGKPEVFTFGKDSNQVQVNARPITIYNRNINEQEYNSKARELGQKLANDTKVAQQLKSKYPSAVKVLEGLNLIFPEVPNNTLPVLPTQDSTFDESDEISNTSDTDQFEFSKLQAETDGDSTCTLDNFESGTCGFVQEQENIDSSTKCRSSDSRCQLTEPANTNGPIISSIPSREEYEKSVDSWIETIQGLFNSDETDNENDEASKSLTPKPTEQQITVKNQPSIYYMDIATGEITAIKTQATTSFSQSSLEEFKNNNQNTAYNFIKDGLVVTNVAYDIRMGAQVEQINLPTNYKDENIISTLIDNNLNQ